MNRKIIWFISLAILVVPLLIVGCGGSDENIAITNISNNSGDSSGARIAVDSDNNLHVVWFDLSTGVNQIMYSEKAPAGDWTQPVNLSNSFSNSRSPEIAVDSQDTVHVVWHEYAGKFRIFYTQKPRGGIWSEPLNVTSNREAATYPSMSLDGQGNLHLVWEEDKLKQDTELYYTDIYYSKRNVDGTWTNTVNISNNDGDSTKPVIVVDSQGNLYVVWEDDTTGVHQIYYVNKPKDGAWSESVIVTNSDSTFSDPLYQTLIVDNQNTLHMAWNDIHSDNLEILYSSKPLGGSWSEAVNVSKNIRNSGVPAFAVDGRDTLYLAWNDDTPGKFDIFCMVKSEDGTWGRVTNVSKTSEESGDASIAVDSSYNLHVVWSEKITDKNNWDIVYTMKAGIEAD